MFLADEDLTESLDVIFKYYKVGYKIPIGGLDEICNRNDKAGKT